MKLRIIRGPNCCDARVRARMVIENTTPTTVMTAAAMAISTCRPASALPVSHPRGQGQVVVIGGQVDLEGDDEQEHGHDDEEVGTTQKVVRRASHRQSGSRMLRWWTWSEVRSAALFVCGSVTVLLASTGPPPPRADQTSRRSAPRLPRRQAGSLERAVLEHPGPHW